METLLPKGHRLDSLVYFSFISNIEVNPYQRSEGCFFFLLFAAYLSEFLGCIQVHLLNRVNH
jgi:hypothetical protein